MAVAVDMEVEGVGMAKALTSNDTRRGMEPTTMAAVIISFASHAPPLVPPAGSGVSNTTGADTWSTSAAALGIRRGSGDAPVVLMGEMLGGRASTSIISTPWP